MMNDLPKDLGAGCLRDLYAAARVACGPRVDDASLSSCLRHAVAAAGADAGGIWAPRDAASTVPVRVVEWAAKDALRKRLADDSLGIADTIARAWTSGTNITRQDASPKELAWIFVAPLEVQGSRAGVLWLAKTRGASAPAIDDLAVAEACRIMGAALSRHEGDLVHRVRDGAMALRGELLAYMRDAVALTDASGHVVYANRSLSELVGYASAELVGQPLRRFFAPLVPNQGEIIEPDTPRWSGRLAVRCKDGAHLVVDANMTRIVLDEPEPYALFVFVAPTDLRRKELELEATRQRLQHLLTASPSIIYTRSIASPFPLRFISTDVSARLGYDFTQFLTGTDFWFELLHPDDVSRAVAHVRESVERGTGVCEYRLRNGNGAYRWMRDEAKVVPGVDGPELIGCWVDITKHKNTELALEQQTRRLSRSNRELEQFAYAASHDLRTPLRAIQTLAEWLEADLGDKLEGESLHQMRLLRGRVQRMDRLLTDLLEYARVGRTAIPMELVDLAELVREVVDLSNLSEVLEVRVAEPPPRFATAKTHLKRVLLNLLNNAAKHHDLPRGHVDIHTEMHGDWIEFTVADDGPGIPVEFHERIFQMFQTLKPRDVKEGTGMGLALVRRLVESGGGRVWVEPTEGRGTLFHFTWPRIWPERSSSSGNHFAAPKLSDF